MLESETRIDTKEFKETFNKKFSNFCRKAPLFLSYIITERGVDIYVHNDPHDRQKKKLLFNYAFNFSQSVKENIFNIRIQLVRYWYPRLYQTVFYEEPYDAQELNNMVERGEISVDDIGTKGLIREKTIEWRIERVIVMKDILFVRNLDTGEIHSFRMKMPATIFLRKINNKSKEQAWELFERKSVFIQTMEEDQITINALWRGGDEYNASEQLDR